MNIRFVLRYLGLLWMGLAATMLTAVAVSLFYGERDAIVGMLAGIGIGLVAGGAGYALGRREEGDFFRREGLAVVAFGWLTVAAIGAAPFVVSGAIPSVVDAYFESMSGFTTTGASLLVDIEALPKGILFWRSFTHWLGGMGIIVLFVALLPALGAEGKHLYRVEIAGVQKEGLRPRIQDTALVLWLIYAALTFTEIVCLKVAGLSWFNAACHAFGTIATGGFSPLNASVGAFQSPLIEGIIIVFMILAGVNFTLYYNAFQAKGNLRAIVADTEFRTYIGILAASVLILTGVLAVHSVHPALLGAGDIFVGPFRAAIFSATSMQTNTGFGSTDFVLWPTVCGAVLVCQSLIGGCAGSTGGGIKVLRVIIIVKYAYRELARFFQPKVVRAVRVGRVAVDDDQLRAVTGFLMLFALMAVAGTVVLAADGVDLVTAATATISALCNAGPGLGAVGPAANYEFLHPVSKVALSALMLMGRLELYSFLVVFLPGFWRA